MEKVSVMGPIRRETRLSWTVALNLRIHDQHILLYFDSLELSAAIRVLLCVYAESLSHVQLSEVP